MTHKQLPVAHEPLPGPAIVIRAGADNLLKTSYLQSLSDTDLTVNLRLLVSAQGHCTAAIVAHLIELDRRDLPQRRALPSLFAYCVRELGLTEDVACRHIVAVRAAQKFPSVLGALAQGEINLSVLCILSRHLTPGNHRSLLGWAGGRSKREVERKAAELGEGPPASREVIRYLPVPPTPAPTPPSEEQPLLEWAAARPPEDNPPSVTGDCESRSPQDSPQIGSSNAPRLVRIAFTAGEDLLARIDRAKGFLRHKYPSGRLDDIFKEILDFYLLRRDPGLKAKPAAPRPAAARVRRIPQWAKDMVWRRDAGRCAYVSSEGTRCVETGGLEFDHVRPWSLGGRSDDPANVRLLCRSHNRAEARRVLG